MGLRPIFSLSTVRQNTNLFCFSKVYFVFREIIQCFYEKNDGTAVTFVLMGDSRVRNLFEYFQFMVLGNFTPWAVKPHRNLNATYLDFNFQVDFLWGPQTETGNQDAFKNELNLCTFRYIAFSML